jgi:hypothetical protein
MRSMACGSQSSMADPQVPRPGDTAAFLGDNYRQQGPSSVPWRPTTPTASPGPPHPAVSLAVSLLRPAQAHGAER